MSTAAKEPKHCGDCGELCGFGDVPTKKKHTCQKLCLTPRRKSAGTLMAFSAQTQSSSSLRSSELDHPVHLELMDSPNPVSSSSAPVHECTPSFLSSSTASLSIPPDYSRPDRALVQRLARLAIEAGVQQLTLDVQEHMSMRLGSLQDDVKTTCAEVRRAQRESRRMEKEKQEAEEKAAELERQVEVSVETLADLKQELIELEKELSLKQQEVCDLDRFVQETAEREASAKIRLQSFIESLLARAARAERQLQELHTLSHTHTAAMSYDGSFSSVRRALQRRSCSASGISSSCYSPCEHTGSPVRRSGGCETVCQAECYQRNLSDMEADSDSWSVYSTESQKSLQQHYGAYKTNISAYSSHFLRHGQGLDQSVMCSKQMKRRAWLFCVFSYLDTHSLVITAQVCKEWRSVGQHPALWTRVTLENNRISSKFMITMAQWCTQTHTLILRHLKPRSRAKKESKEEYQNNTRGCLEEGLEAVLRSAGRSLRSLSISHCPNILTDRTLWLISCHCRALHTLIYRSSSDPVGQEVIWALGAGCWDITSLSVAPLQPCQQPSRFSNRCLQTIGRCWPHLRQVRVGGAGCGLQGLTSLVRNCSSVCVLELDHMGEISQQGAADLCREGLQQLHTLIFSYTPVTAKAILHFHSVCLRLKCVMVLMSSAENVNDPESEETKRIFNEMTSSLQALKKRPGLSDILQVRMDQCDIVPGS